MVKKKRKQQSLKQVDTTGVNYRPPIVVVLGHVDHGKTTLLDTIRKTDVVAKEAGGITQHIGAYQINIKNQKSKLKNEEDKRITFIDTPGHEAFTKMRAHGSQIADVAILVVAADDGVMPQTEESIKLIQSAQLPFIVAFNKIDLPDIDTQKVKQQLANAGVLVEDFGGDVVMVPISAKIGTGINELLEVILLVAEMNHVTGDPQASLDAVIIESRLDKQQGPLGTVLVRDGTLTTGDAITAGRAQAKVRRMTNANGQVVKTAGPATPVEAMGWNKVPPIGASVNMGVTPKAHVTKPVKKFSPYALELPPVKTTKKLKLVIRADVKGSLEAVVSNLDKEQVEVISADVGEITESDIHLAKSAEAIIIGFNVTPSKAIVRQAELEQVRIRTYQVIYTLFEEIQEVVDILSRPEAQEEILGEAKILAEFNTPEGRVAGCKVLSGVLSLGDMTKLVRDDKNIGRAKIKSLKQGKLDVKKVKAEEECGILFARRLDFKLSDSIIAYKKHELL